MRCTTSSVLVFTMTRLVITTDKTRHGAGAKYEYQAQVGGGVSSYIRDVQDPVITRLANTGRQPQLSTASKLTSTSTSQRAGVRPNQIASHLRNMFPYLQLYSLELPRTHKSAAPYLLNLL